jgi:hypothetical protein
MGLKEIMCEGVDWIQLALDMDQWGTLVNPGMNLQVPLKENNFRMNIK